MRFLFAINHPSQFHMFKNLAKKLQTGGHEVIFFIQQRGIIEDLAETAGFQYKFLVSPFWKKCLKGRIGVALRGIAHLIEAELKVFLYCMLNRVDILLGSDISITHVARLLGRASLAFTDDDYYFIDPYSRLAFPHATGIVSPKVVNLGKWSTKQIAYPGTQKTAYLHPNVFFPRPSVPTKYGLSGQRYIIIRQVEFNALHDSMNTAVTGITDSVIDKILLMFGPTHRIILNYEGTPNPKYREHILKIDPSDMLDLIFYADLLVGDSQSMQVEAGLLGTPSIRSNKWVQYREKVSVIHYIEDKYDLCSSILPGDTDSIISKAQELTAPDAKNVWREKTYRFYQENVSLTDFLYWLLADFRNRHRLLIKDPELVTDFIIPGRHCEDLC